MTIATCRLCVVAATAALIGSNLKAEGAIARNVRRRD